MCIRICHTGSFGQMSLTTGTIQTVYLNSVSQPISHGVTNLKINLEVMKKSVKNLKLANEETKIIVIGFGTIGGSGGTCPHSRAAMGAVPPI